MPVGKICHITTVDITTLENWIRRLIKHRQFTNKILPARGWINYELH